MTEHRIATREEWQEAREELLRREKEHTRMGDELARQRRELPWVPVTKEYQFETDEGTRSLAELFDGRLSCSSTTSCSARVTRPGAPRARRTPTL
jgi:predicted dithiol-disulfide oxidoreductase (DUF899 family)